MTWGTTGATMKLLAAVAPDALWATARSPHTPTSTRSWTPLERRGAR